MRKQLELLAPAGSYETLVSVVNAGADAVYLGGSKFGARAFANNFSEEELLRAIDYTHMKNKKIILAVNTLLKNDEIKEELYQYLQPYYTHGIDAIIVQDMGVFQFVKEHFPELPIHTSTQMTITSAQGVKLLEQMGAKRAVLARELSMSEIAQIHTQTDIELEAFVHGALCYCYSGKCLLSSVIGGRSGNRGRCAQPCRLPYEVYDGTKKLCDPSYVLSLKDFCAIENLAEMAEAGVYSFKIEGRMKQKEYAAGVVELYRKYMDLYLSKGIEGYAVSKKDRNRLLDLGSRSGFTNSYFTKRNDADMITMDAPSHKKSDAIEVNCQADELKEPIMAKLKLLEGRPAQLSLSYRDLTVEAMGEVIQHADKKPADRNDVLKKIDAFGTTFFELKEIDLEMDEQVFVPASQLKALRREAVAKLEQQILQPFRRETFDDKKDSHDELVKENRQMPYLAVSVANEKQLKQCLNVPFVNKIYIEADVWIAQMKQPAFLTLLKEGKMHGKEISLILPEILRNDMTERLLHEKEILKTLEIDGFVAGGYDGIGLLENLNISKEKVLLDASVYTFSNEALDTFEKMGYHHFTMPLELNYHEIAKRRNEQTEYLLYGYVPVMVSAQCVKNTMGGCKKSAGNASQQRMSDDINIVDRMKKKFPVRNHCMFCYNTIYNSAPLVLFHHEKEISKINAAGYRVAFTFETEAEITNILHTYEKAFLKKVKVTPDEIAVEFTNGHWKRGVE